jgi:[protein-PII] uridylyltransferase
MLYLLSVGDSMATGPKAWNDWTASLLRQLFLKVANVLERGELASSAATQSITAKKIRILDQPPQGIPAAALAALLEAMTPRYLLYAGEEEILSHILLHNDLGEREFVLRTASDTASNTRILTLCGRDRPGLLSRIAGVLTINSIDILDVQAFTWRNGIVLDVFKVRPPPDPLFEEERWQRIRDHLGEVLAGRMDLARNLQIHFETALATRPVTGWNRPPQVKVDNGTSSFFTLIEVVADNSPGLLFRIADALFRCGLDVRVAKIATKVDQVVDVFYVRDLDGQKVDSPEQVAAIQEAIEAVLLHAGSGAIL